MKGEYERKILIKRDFLVCGCSNWMLMIVVIVSIEKERGSENCVS